MSRRQLTHGEVLCTDCTWSPSNTIICVWPIFFILSKINAEFMTVRLFICEGRIKLVLYNKINSLVNFYKPLATLMTVMVDEGWYDVSLNLLLHSWGVCGRLQLTLPWLRSLGFVIMCILKLGNGQCVWVYGKHWKIYYLLENTDTKSSSIVNLLFTWSSVVNLIV